MSEKPSTPLEEAETAYTLAYLNWLEADKIARQALENYHKAFTRVIDLRIAEERKARKDADRTIS